MKYVALCLLLFVTLAVSATLTALAQPAQVRPGARVYIAPMEGDLHTFLAAEIIKQKVPINVVISDELADYILTGVSVKTGEGKWFDVMFGTPKDKNEGSAQLVSVATKSLVWAGEAGDRSLMWGSLKRGGQRKVASRIVSKMKKDLFKDYEGEGWQVDAALSERQAAPAPTSAAAPAPTPKKACYENGVKVPCP